MTSGSLTNDLIIEKLKFCGCGDPESVLNLLHDFIALTIKHREEKTPKISGAEWEAYCDRQSKEKNEFIKNNTKALLWLLFYVLDEKDIFTHGGNVSGGWVHDVDFWEALKKWKSEQANAD